MKFIISITLILSLYSCSQNRISKVDFLVGTWKVENKDQFEDWKLTRDNKLTGYSFTVEGGEKKVTETLVIEVVDQAIIYKATVPDQNEGKTISFYLNENMSQVLSFENPEHDFPKKIQYKRVSKDSIEVTVLGDGNEGFSYRQIRTDN